MGGRAVGAKHFAHYLYLFLIIRLLSCSICDILSSEANEGGTIMALSTLTSRVDEEDKVMFIAFCDSVGLTTSAAINMFVKAVIRERRIPFEIKADDPFYSLSNQMHLMKSVQQLRDGKGSVHDLIEE